MKKNVHDGHRTRLREEYLKNGIDSFSDLHVLELLLCFAIPRGDVNPTAHELLERFGSFAGVMDASGEELLKTKGVGVNTMVLLKMLPELSRRYLISSNGKRALLDSPVKSARFVSAYFYRIEDERVYLVSLDAKLQVLGVDLVSEGDINSAAISVRKMVARAIERKAVKAILSHNHPSGAATPSEEDSTVTRQVRTAMKMVGIDLVDHIIVSEGQCFSMAEAGFFT